MNARQDGTERGLLDEALFAEEPTSPPDLTAVAVEALTPDEPARPAPAVREGDSYYALTHLAPGVYEVSEPGGPRRAEPRVEREAEPLPSPVQVQFPEFELNDLDPEPEPLPSYEWPEPDDADPTTVLQAAGADEPTEEVYEVVAPAPPAAEAAPPAVEVPPPPPATERRPLLLTINAGLTLRAGESGVLTSGLLRVVGDDPFLLDILVLSAPEQGALLRDGFALTGGDVFTQEDLDHGRISYRHEGDVGEDGFVFATPQEEVPATIFAIRVEPARLAPELLGPGRLSSPVEGMRVADLLRGTARSHEPDLEPGLALTGATGRGQWEYSLDGGASWQPVGEVESTHPFLLGPSDRFRFVPRPGWSGRVQLTYRAWDRSAGEAGARVDLAGPEACGGATAFSEAAVTLSATLGPPAARRPVTEPWREPLSAEGLVGAAAAVVRVEGDGVWQFSLDGGRSWQDFGDVFHGRARLLRDQDRVRFLPRRGAWGKVAISARPWDGAAFAAGEVVNLAGHRAVGDGTAFGEVALTRAWRLGV
ncbi:MAG: cadherin-like domain-containing protein [Gemmataceae bacterium]